MNAGSGTYRRLVLVALIGAVSACRDASLTDADLSRPEGLDTPSLDLVPPPSVVGEMWVCKASNSADFEIRIRHPDGTTTTEIVSLGVDECALVYANATSTNARVWVTEIPDDNLESISVETNTNGTIGVNNNAGNGFFRFISSTRGATATFTNFAGCPQGDWKSNASEAFWPAPYSRSMLFSAVFEDAFPGLTLQEVLELRGGGLNRLGAQTVAALLNGAHPDINYDLTAAEVIAKFNALYPTNSKGRMNALKNEFEEYNKRGCPLF